MWKYESIFKKEFADIIANNSTVIKDIDWAIKNCINSDWTLNLKELVYLIMIWIERARKD